MPDSHAAFVRVYFITLLILKLSDANIKNGIRNGYQRCIDDGRLWPHLYLLSVTLPFNAGN